jgi:hypothetical protein
MHQAFVPYALPELTSFQLYKLAKGKTLLEIETFYFGEGPKCFDFFLLLMPIKMAHCEKKSRTWEAAHN